MTIDLNEVLLAALAVHCDQVRDDGLTPVIVHPLGTMRNLILVAKIDDPEMAAAAILHDTIEDAKPEDRETIRQDILESYGRRVLGLVEGLTLPDGLSTERKQLMLLGMMVSRPADVVILKLCDRLDNLSDMRGWKVARQARYIEESRELFAAAVKRFYEQPAGPSVARLQDRLFRLLDDLRTGV